MNSTVQRRPVFFGTIYLQLIPIHMVKNSHGVSSKNNPNKTRKTAKRRAAKRVMLAAKKKK
jgi:hypothetical protein